MSQSQKLDFKKFIPSATKSDLLDSLVSNTFNRFVSEEQSVLVNGRVGVQTSFDPAIQASTLDREANALIPALYFKSGSEEHVFTFKDMVNRLDVLDTDVSNMKSWMAEQSFSYYYPINYDKFINYANYFWVKREATLPSWNPTDEPEFYVIGLPKPTDPVKKPVDLATTPTDGNLTLWANNRPVETFTITFTSNQNFNITSDTGVVYSLTNILANTFPTSVTTVVVQDENHTDLIKFNIIVGSNHFSAGDTFTVNITYFTSDIFINLISNNPIGKGAISAVENLSSIIKIDGIEVKANDRILVKNQTDETENGIYIVSIGTKWSRAIDAFDSTMLYTGSKVFTRGGLANIGQTFIATGAIGSNILFNQDTTLPVGTNLLNDWQEYNAWVHREDFQYLVNGDSLFANAIQATRPIVEYINLLELNDSVLNGEPVAPGVGTTYKQSKNAKDQIPQFNLYRYDGTHSGSTSGIFYYVEDQNYPIDAIISKRLKTTSDNDYIFGMGIKDTKGRLLYFKTGSELKSVWQAGVIDSVASLPVIFNGGSDRGALTIDYISPSADNQGWIITAISATEFTVGGTRSGTLTNATVGIQYVCDDVKFTITAGLSDFVAHESFAFYIHAKSSPRYVIKNAEGAFINYPGGVTADLLDGTANGVWLCPARMFQNLPRDTTTEIIFGDLLNHTRSVIKNQNGFEGTSFGINNVRNLDFDPGLGGTIKEFSSNFPLLSSMLIQQDVSPLTLIDFAENQYLTALSSVDQFMINDFGNYLSTGAVVLSPESLSLDASGKTIIPDDILKLAEYFENLRSSNEILKNTFSDSTALVKNWPVTLPMMGLKPNIIPSMATFDNELGINTITHHDGHISPLSTRDATFDRNLVKASVERSDGTNSPGIFSETQPALPYARQLWLKPSTFQLFIFDVSTDAESPDNGTVEGEYWFSRVAPFGLLKKWDATGMVWLPSGDAISDRWKEISTATIRNVLLLSIENKLYDSVHPYQTLVQDISAVDNSAFSEIELAKFAAKYGYDTYAGDYDAADAFTWNYASTGLGARWFDVLKNNFTVSGIYPTCRPNLEPWKLGTLSIPASETKPANWDATYASTVVATTPSVIVRCVATSPVAPLFGIQTIDNILLSSGDVVLLTGQSSPIYNGVYTITSTGWSRTADVLQNGTTISVTEGDAYEGTYWVITSADPFVVGTDPIVVEQYRSWKQQMWTDIKAAHPSLKLSVNIYTDTLLPPFVSASKIESSEAIMTTQPINPSASYSFGQNGPIETVWKKSIEFGYSQCRSTFKTDPMAFLDKGWGDTYIQIGSNVRVDRNLLTPLQPVKFLLHGEKLNIINNYTASEVASRITGVALTTPSILKFVVTHCADNLTVFSKYIDETFSSYLVVGVTGLDGITISDKGIPYDMGETLTVVFDGTNYSYNHTQATYKVFKGWGQIFTNVLRYNYVDTELSKTIQSYRDWDVKLVHRLGAMIRPDSLTINTSQGDLPTTSYNVILKKSSNIKSVWITGLRIQLVQMGLKALNPEGLYYPKEDGSNWIFRIEAYNSQHPMVERYILNTTGLYETFFALSKQKTDVEWKRYTEKVSLETTALPKVITGIQNVLTFIYGYIDRLEELGWTISTEEPITDVETGRNVNWQLDIEKFINTVYSGMELGAGHILNPFSSRLDITTPYGLTSTFTQHKFIDAYSMQSVYDITGTAIPLSNLSIIRNDEKTVVYSKIPMFSAHIFLDEYEHVILMNQKFSDAISSATIFDTFLGLRLNTAYLSFIRNTESIGKPTFNGFFLSGNDVKRNITSSIDAMGNYYDADKTFYEPTTAPHALALLGYTSKDYFSALNVNSTTQFNFWRGLIQAKGTNMAIDAFVNYKKFESASTDEYWAYKLATFGDARERTFPEFKIEPADTFQKFSKFQFYSADDSSYVALPLFTQIENSDDTRWFSIDDLGTGMSFDAEAISETITTTGNGYVSLSNIYHNGDTMEPTISGGATFISANLVYVPAAGTYNISGYTWNNPVKHSPIKLFDYVNNVLEEEISLWHPAIGIHAPAPLELVNIISDLDPAHYNYTTQTSNNPSYRTLKPWGQKEVGRVFWDTSNLAYVPYYDAKIFPSIDARHARWGALAGWASVDLYEWTESNVHPSKYNALAEIEEGDSSIDSSIRASGTVGFTKNYSRTRTIYTKPIAWSKSENGFAAAHPSFGPAEFTKVWVSGNSLIADTGRTADANLVSGRNFGGWDVVNAKPVGEVTIGSTMSYYLGTESSISGSITNATVKISVIPDGLFGVRIGKINLTRKSASEYVVRMSDSTGFYEDMAVSDWTSDNLTSDNTLVFSFTTFGLKITVTRTAIGTITANTIVSAIASSSNDIYVREAVSFTSIIGLDYPVYINDDSDADYSLTEYEWRTWSVPTQAELDADLLYPHNTWVPYLGDVEVISPSSSIIADMNKSSSALIMKDGTEVSRYSSVWSNWTVLEDTKTQQISNGVDIVKFQVDSTIDINRVSMYVNGVQMNPSAYTIVVGTDGLTYVKLINKQLEGFIVTLLYRAYSPSDADLAFDPAVADDFSVQTQYKSDYQYTQLEVRDDSGNVSGTKYYFWVQDKTVVKPNKAMSLLTAKEILTAGPSTFMLYSKMVGGAKPAYDSFAISGLNMFVTKNDSYKLRMLRNFTLLDDPEEMSLKNVHTEWQLIRKQMTSKIPQSLWTILTNAVAGEDAGGNTLPSQTRIDYDSRNGTRSRYGFGTGQIFAETSLLRTSITNTILNTAITLNLVNKIVPDYLTVLDFNNSDNWFIDAATARATMDLIWSKGKASQINEIFFDTLDDALSNNYEFSDIFKTSLITVNSVTIVTDESTQEQMDEFY